MTLQSQQPLHREEPEGALPPHPLEVSHTTLALEGMTCASCAIRIEKGLKRVPGVLDASVNLATERGTVTYDPSLLGVVLALPVIILSMFLMNRFPGENLLLLALTTPAGAIRLGVSPGSYQDPAAHQRQYGYARLGRLNGRLCHEPRRHLFAAERRRDLL